MLELKAEDRFAFKGKMSTNKLPRTRKKIKQKIKLKFINLSSLKFAICKVIKLFELQFSTKNIEFSKNMFSCILLIRTKTVKD